MKNKLFILLAISLIFFLLFGTSLALGVLSNDNHVSEHLTENGTETERGTSHWQPEPEQADETPEETETSDSNGELPDAEEPAEPEGEQTRADETDKAKRIDQVEEAKPIEKTPKEPEKKPEELGQTDPVPQPEPKQMALVIIQGLNVRPAPSTDNQRIAVLLLGQTVEVLAEQNNWLQVKLPDGRTGWVFGEFVSRFTPSVPPGDALAGRVIVIDPGHGGKDPGAIGPTGLLEKEVNLDVSLRVAEKLRALGAQVIMTRDTDVFISLAERVAIAEAARAEIFISVHANAHPNPQIGGTETYYFRGKTSASLNLAAQLQGELVDALGLRDIGVKDATFYVIRQTSMPSALVELAFLSNAHEESLLRTNAFRQKAAEALVRGIINYFD